MKTPAKTPEVSFRKVTRCVRSSGIETSSRAYRAPSASGNP